MSLGFPVRRECADTTRWPSSSLTPMYPHFEEKNSTLRERRTRSVCAPNVFRTASTFSKPLKYFVNGRSSIFTTRGNQTPTLFGLNAFAMGPPESTVANQAAGWALSRAALEPAPLRGARLSAAARLPDFFPHGASTRVREITTSPPLA